MGCITIGNQGLNPKGGGIPSSKLRSNFENQRVSKLFAINLAVKTRIEIFCEEQAFDYLMFCLEINRITIFEAEEIFNECF